MLSDGRGRRRPSLSRTTRSLSARPEQRCRAGAPTREHWIARRAERGLLNQLALQQRGELAALQPDSAAAYPDRIGDHRGQDDGLLARPQHRTMADRIPDLILGVSGAELVQRRFKPRPAALEFIASFIRSSLQSEGTRKARLLLLPPKALHALWRHCHGSVAHPAVFIRIGDVVFRIA